MPFVTLTTNLSSEKVDKAFSESFSEKLAETLGKPIEVSRIDKKKLFMTTAVIEQST